MKQIPIALSIRQLKQLARHPKRFREDITKMLDYYQNQDIHRLYKTSKRQLQGLRKVLLYDRNRSMALSIMKLAQNESLFAAFGVGHLSGAKGVLRYLKLAGYRIQPIII